MLTCNLDGTSSCSPTSCTAWPWYVHCFAITVTNNYPALVILPEYILLKQSQSSRAEAFFAGLEKYASFANVAKAVDEALHAEKKGIDPARLGKALLQIAENNSFSVDA